MRRDHNLFKNNNGHSITKHNISKIKSSVDRYNSGLDTAEHKTSKLKTNKNIKTETERK